MLQGKRIVASDFGPYFSIFFLDDERNEHAVSTPEYPSTIWKAPGWTLPPYVDDVWNSTPLAKSQYQPPPGVVVSDWGAAAFQAEVPVANYQPRKPAGMDFYGNIINDAGESIGQDYEHSQAFYQAKAANEGLQSAVANNNAASAAWEQGIGSAEAVEQASIGVTNALKTYTEAGAQITSSAPESHIDDTLTPGPILFSEPVNALPKQILVAPAPLPVPLLIGALIVLAKILL